MTLRILHVLDHSIPLHSGYTFRTLSILREQRKLGWETFHLTSPKQGDTAVKFDDVDGLRFYRTPLATGALARLPIAGELALMKQTETRLEAVAREVKPDIIHAHSPVLNAIPAIKVARRLGIPVVYEIRAFWEDAAVDHGTTSEGSLRYRATRALETRAIRQVDHVFTICEGLRSDIAARGIAREKITVIPNAVDVESFNVGGVPDEALKAQLNLSGATVVGFIGSFYAYEGLDLLLEALPLILSQLPDVRVLLVGGGPQEAALKEQARRLGIEDKVIFTGRVPHDEVQRYYDLIDVLAYPRHSMRLTNLVTPLKPLESMAQGRLLVASDVGGHKELIRHGETGMLFHAGSAISLAETITELLTRRDNWPKIRAAGRRFVETERTWTESVSRYVDIYGRLISERARVGVGALPVGLVGPLPPPFGGMANQTRQLATLLRGKGLPVLLFQTNAEYRPRWISRARFIRALFRLVPYLLLLWRNVGRCRILHVMANSGWSWHLLAAPAIWMARLRHVPVVVNYRGGEAEAFLSRSPRAVGLTMRQASALIVPSGFLKAVFERFGMAATIVPNIVDLDLFSNPSPHRSARRRLLIARNLEPIYDNETAIRAFAIVRQEHPDATLSVAGSGPLAESLKDLVQSLGLGAAVTFAGRLDRDAMSQAYREADIAINPSLVDNMPNSVLEALASGVPLVSTDVGGVPFIVTDEHTALLVPPKSPQAMAEAILRLMNDPGLAERLIDNGLREVKKYTWAEVWPLLSGAYGQATGAAGSPI